MRTIEIIRATVAGGKRVGVGEVVELADHHATELIALGKAVPIVDPPVADNRDAEVEKKTSKRATTTSKPQKKKKAD
jgi:hypothetical protein